MPQTASVWDERNPFPWYAEMRANHPVHLDEHGVIHVFRYADVQRVLSDHEHFSSNFSGDQNPNNPLSASLITTDPPRHRELRSLVSQAFTPRAIQQLAPRIEAITNELLDGVAHEGRMDLVEHFAYPLPVIVIAELLGIPSEHRDRFKQWSDAVVTNTHEYESNSEVHIGNPQREMAAYFMQLIAARKETPADDLISALLAAQIDGQHLNELELLGFCILLLVAGNETTTNLITNAVECLLTYPDSLKQLQDEPALLPTAIEEVLRYRSPVQSMYRVCKADTELRGIRIRQGQPLVAWIGSANRDEQVFGDAEIFRIDRAPNKHIAFGHGIHFCLGAPLARLEGRIALTELLRRFEHFTAADPSSLRPIPSSIVHGLQNLPLTFTARA